MNNQHFRRLVGFTILGLFLLVVGCTPRAYLIVDYQVPPNSSALAGQRLQLQVIDKRSDPYVLAPAVARQFEGFENRYSLAWVTEKSRTLAGDYDLQQLIYRAFEKRLTTMGITASAEGQQGLPVLQVELLSLNVNQVELKWVAQMSLSATLSRADGPVAKQTLRGSAERLKVVGRKGADNVLSDVISDVINRLDMESLFKQAGLI